MVTCHGDVLASQQAAKQDIEIFDISMVHCQSSRNYATDRKDFPQCPVMAAVYDCSANIAPNALFTFCSCVYRAAILLMVLMWCCRCISSSPRTIRCQGSPGGLGGATTGTQLLHLLQPEMCIQWRQRGGSMGGNHRVDNKYYGSNIPDWGKSVVAVAGVLVGT